MSKIVKAVVGVGFIAVGVLTGNAQFIVAGASLTISAVLGPGGPKTPTRQAAATTLQLGEQPRQAVFGEALVGGTLLTGFNHGGKYGTDREVLAIALADHRCDALVGFYVGDKYVAFAGDGEVAGYGGQLKVTWHPGTADQAADATLVAQGGYTAADRLQGLCYVVVEYKADEADAKNPVWTAGRPQFGWVVRGKRCYDPRLDDTVAGGAGPHRWADPATWTWTDNLAVCRYNWVRGVYAGDRIDEPGQLLIGRGLSPIEAPPERVAAAANLCDEPVALAGGGSEPRYRVSAVIGADEVHGEIEAKFAAACAGVVLQPDGSIEVEPGHAKAAVAFITDADLVVGKPVTFSDHRSEADEEWCNSVVGRYVEPTQKWAEHAAPIRRVVADLVADGGPRERTLPLAYVRSGSQAQRCAEVVRRLGRLPKTGTITLGPRFCELEEGDWIVWTSARRTRGLPVVFRIEAFSRDAGWQMTLTLREISMSVFGWTAADQIAEGAVAVQQVSPPVAAFVPSGGAVALRGTYPRGLTVTGAELDGEGRITLSAHELDYPGFGAVPMEERTLTGLVPGTTYYLFVDTDGPVDPAPVYGATTDYTTALNSSMHPDRLFLQRSITLPATGGSGTTGEPTGGGYGGTRDTYPIQ